MKHNNQEYVLSIDAGTSSIRTRLYDTRGNELEAMSIQRTYTMDRTSDGGEFIDLDRIVQLIFEIIDESTKWIEEQGIRVIAVSCCTFWHNLVGVNEKGEACTSLLNWSDTRPECVLPDLAKRIEPTHFTQRTGCPFHASYLPAKIVWLKNNMPERVKHLWAWMSLGEYLFFRLTGERVCSYSMASGTGLLHSAKCEWDSEIFEAIGVERSQVSNLGDLDEGGFFLRDEFKQRWPGLRDAQWFPAIGDGAASNIGCGAVTPERLTLMVGTSGAMRMVWKGDYREPAQGLWCYRIDRHRPISGGALSNGGNLLQWAMRTLKLGDLKQIEEALRNRTPDAHGLTFLPFLAGQRSPRWNPESRGLIHGLRLSTEPIDILQAGMEAVAYRFRLIYELLSNQVERNQEMIATGGALLQLPVWIQIMADVIQCVVYPSQVKEGSCRGAALLVLEALGAIEDISRIETIVDEPFYPREEAFQFYEKGFQRHLALEEKHIRANKTNMDLY